MDTFWNHILPEGMDKIDFFIYLGYFALGALTNFFLDVRGSIRHNRTTPVKFKFGFLILDNLARGIAVIIMIIVMVLNFEEIFNIPITGLLAYCLGLDIDLVIGKLLSEGKDFSPIKRQRQKLLDKYNNV